MLISEKLMLLFKYIFLGFVQGFTEPIPVSSSGHVLIIRHLFNIDINGLSFEIIVNFGSLIAIIIIYKNSIKDIFQQSMRYVFNKGSHNQKIFHFFIMLCISTLTTGIIGLLAEDFITQTLSNLYIVGVSLFITAFALWIIRHLNGSKGDQQITTKDAIIIGIAQSFALIPGISRSGATIVAALLLGLKRKTALKFSFLLYIPVSLGITVLSIPDIIQDPNITKSVILYILACLTSIIATFFALRWFIRIMINGRLVYFSIYCVLLGITILAFLTP